MREDTLSKYLLSSETRANISKNIFIFPNPANGKINVVLSNSAVKNNLRWEITDITGVKLNAGNVANMAKGDVFAIPVDNLKNGIYQFRFNDGLNILLNKFVMAR